MNMTLIRLGHELKSRQFTDLKISSGPSLIRYGDTD